MLRGKALTNRLPIGQMTKVTRLASVLLKGVIGFSRITDIYHNSVWIVVLLASFLASSTLIKQLLGQRKLRPSGFHKFPRVFLSIRNWILRDLNSKAKTMQSPSCRANHFRWKSMLTNVLFFSPLACFRVTCPSLDNAWSTSSMIVLLLSTLLSRCKACEAFLG